jgi:NAD(P)-dependent dehydrogenase (short-subunit alcohol dehydrogenase family)
MVHSKAANGSTIGLGITEAFAHSGANVVLNGFGDAVQIEKTRSELAHGSKAKVVYSPADLSKPRAIAHMVRQTVDMFGSVDIMVNNAGIPHVSSIEEFPEVGRQRRTEEPAQQALRRGGRARRTYPVPMHRQRRLGNRRGLAHGRRLDRA